MLEMLSTMNEMSFISKLPSLSFNPELSLLEVTSLSTCPSIYLHAYIHKNSHTHKLPMMVASYIFSSRTPLPSPPLPSNSCWEDAPANSLDVSCPRDGSQMA